MLSFDNLEVKSFDSKYVVENLRVMHFVNCSMTTISTPDAVKVFLAAGNALKKVNLAHNSIAEIPD